MQHKFSFLLVALVTLAVLKGTHTSTPSSTSTSTSLTHRTPPPFVGWFVRWFVGLVVSTQDCVLVGATPAVPVCPTLWSSGFLTETHPASCFNSKFNYADNGTAVFRAWTKVPGAIDTSTASVSSRVDHVALDARLCVCSLWEEWSLIRRRSVSMCCLSRMALSVRRRRHRESRSINWTLD